MSNNSYRVITKIEKKPECLGKKRFRYHDFRGDCGISCTGSRWPKPCDNENYENCDECVCNHCEHCKCEEDNHEEEGD